MRRGVFLVVPALILAGLAADAGRVNTAIVRPPLANVAVDRDPEPDLSRRPPPSVASPPPEPRVVLAARVSQPLVALTFDLDMTSQMAAMARAGVRWVNTDAIRYLRANKVHATLFMTGMWAELYPAVARQLATDPNFEIGNHSYSHPAFHAPCYRLSWVSRASQAQQISFAQQAIQRVTGVTPQYFRFPGGCYDRQALDLVHASGLIPVEWNVNSIDAFNPHSLQIASIVLSSVEPGSIVVMHLMGGPNAPGTSAALRLIVPGLQRKGYRFVTVGELLAAGTPILPTDPREVVEFYQPQPTTATVPIAARRSPRPVPHCSWVHTKRGWVYICG
jgi:peptidoglycan/xylan/chitin deacetylase (PgdA/CDA1 family)